MTFHPPAWASTATDAFVCLIRKVWRPLTQLGIGGSILFKSGPVRSPTIYSAATALPPGYIEGYANKGGSTWRSGICEATIWGGYVRRWSFTEMLLLRRLYG